MLDTALGGAVTAALIGLLLGFEREHSHRAQSGLFAGVRTFPLLALCGFVAGRLVAHGVTWALPATILAIAALAVAAYLRVSDSDPGATTEVAAILATLLGAFVALGEGILASSIAIGVTLLLTMKVKLHRLAGAVSEEEILAILKFGIVAVVLLPLLPNTGYGPYGALVPRRVGIVVVLLSALSLGGYLLVRIAGGRTGWTLAGLMGGLASSTAVTLSFASTVRAGVEDARPFAVGIVLASTVLYARSLVLIGLFDAALAWHLLPRLGVLLLCGAALGWLAYRRLPGEERATASTLRNPAELGKAITLGLLFSAIVVGARVAQAELGARGLWLTGILGGLFDVDSVSIAAAGLRRQGLVGLDTAGGAVLIATLANLLLKGGAVLVVGGRALTRHVAPAFVALAVVTAILLVLARLGA